MQHFVIPAAQRSRPVYGYTLRGSRYLNVTNRCSLRCVFCPKFLNAWDVGDDNLRLLCDPDEDDLVAAAGVPGWFDEVVFCGFGEPTVRLPTVLAVARRLKEAGARVRLNTDGLANWRYGRDVTPLMKGWFDAVSISMNAQCESAYQTLCRPPRPGAYGAMMDFVERIRDQGPEVTVTAVRGAPGVDIDACMARARELGVGFRERDLGHVG